MGNLSVSENPELSFDRPRETNIMLKSTDIINWDPWNATLTISCDSDSKRPNKFITRCKRVINSYKPIVDREID